MPIAYPLDFVETWNWADWCCGNYWGQLFTLCVWGSAQVAMSSAEMACVNALIKCFVAVYVAKYGTGKAAGDEMTCASSATESATLLQGGHF